MPDYSSPAFYIDFSQLPAPAVVETLAYETILSAYKTRVLAANPSLAAALNLEQSATNIILQTEAYGELLVRARINAAARAVMLAFAVGSDLDNLAALYNVVRLTLNDGTSETDARFRRRIQLSPEAFSTAGSEGAYIFHALSSDPTIQDVSAIKLNNRGGVKISVMNSGNDPTPTDTQIANVLSRLTQKNIKPLTDDVNVVPITVLSTTIVANLTLYPGPDQSIVMANVQTALTALRARLTMAGRSLTRSAVITALSQSGVENVALTSPATDFQITSDQCVRLTGATLNVLPTRLQ